MKGFSKVKRRQVWIKKNIYKRENFRCLRIENGEIRTELARTNDELKMMNGMRRKDEMRMQ